MFQLYKSRNFALFFSDTFDFLKKHGKHFLKNFFMVNGIFLIILSVMSYFFFTWYQRFINETVYRINPSNSIENYVNENTGFVILMASLFILVAITVGVLNYAYAPIYFKLYDKHGGAVFKAKDIFDELIANIGKLITYIFVSILVFIPAIIVVGIVGLIMAITIIGIPLLVFLGALFSMFYYFALKEYLYSDKSIFDCFGYSLNLCFQKFFPSVAAAGLFFLMIYICQMMISIIQLLITSLIGITTLEDPSGVTALEDSTSSMFILFFVIQIISYFIGLVFSVITQVNQSIIYFGLKEDKENIHTQSTIDEIGLDA